MRLQIKTAPEPVLVNAAKSWVYEVVSNSLGNAAKFTKSRSIIIKVERTEQDGVQYGLVKVRDTGSGIDSEIMPQLFTKFASKSDHGTGLGLFISRSIIEAHGGRIWGENNSDGIGTTFSFILPIAR